MQNGWQSTMILLIGYENGMTMIEIARRNNVSERTIYRYKAYYDKMRKVEVDE